MPSYVSVSSRPARHVSSSNCSSSSRTTGGSRRLQRRKCSAGACAAPDLQSPASHSEAVCVCVMSADSSGAGSTPAPAAAAWGTWRTACGRERLQQQFVPASAHNHTAGSGVGGEGRVAPIGFHTDTDSNDNATPHLHPPCALLCCLPHACSMGLRNRLMAWSARARPTFTSASASPTSTAPPRSRRTATTASSGASSRAATATPAS